MPAMGASVTPTPISNDNNPTCSDFGAWTELKVEPPGNGEFSDGTLTVTITNFTNSDPKGFDWSSDIGVDAVLVKAGSDKHNLYVYDPEATSDTGLVRPDREMASAISRSATTRVARHRPRRRRRRRARVVATRRRPRARASSVATQPRRRSCRTRRRPAWRPRPPRSS